MSRRAHPTSDRVWAWVGLVGLASILWLAGGWLSVFLLISSVYSTSDLAPPVFLGLGLLVWFEVGYLSRRLGEALHAPATAATIAVAASTPAVVSSVEALGLLRTSLPVGATWPDVLMVLGLAAMVIAGSALAARRHRAKERATSRAAAGKVRV